MFIFTHNVCFIENGFLGRVAIYAWHRFVRLFIEHLLISTGLNIFVCHTGIWFTIYIHTHTHPKTMQNDNGSLPSPLLLLGHTNFPKIVLISNFLNIETIHRPMHSEWHNNLKENRYLHTSTKGWGAWWWETTIVCGHLIEWEYVCFHN